MIPGALSPLAYKNPSAFVALSIIISKDIKTCSCSYILFWTELLGLKTLIT